MEDYVLENYLEKIMNNIGNTEDRVININKTLEDIKRLQFLQMQQNAMNQLLKIKEMEKLGLLSETEVNSLRLSIPMYLEISSKNAEVETVDFVTDFQDRLFTTKKVDKRNTETTICRN